MLPMAVWQALFYASLPVAVFLALRDPIWSAAIAAYLYFAIPPIEFNAASAPYQAAFWAIAVAGSIRYAGLMRTSAREQLLTRGVAAAKAAVAAIHADLSEGIVSATQRAFLQAEGADAEAGRARGLRSPVRAELLSAATGVAEARATELVDSSAPREISIAVRRAVLSTIRHGLELGDREALRIAENAGRATKGNLRSALEERVPAIVRAGVEEKVEPNARDEINRVMDESDRDPSRSPSVGVLGAPLPRGPLTGLLSNPGLYLHILFTLLTYFGAQNAQFSVYKAMGKYETCVLLFIPIIAIICAVRDARHVRIFVGAWMFGTMHLALNAVTWWLQNGGRADNPGGQGGESNFLAGIIVTVAPVTFGMIVNSRTWLQRGLSTGLAAIFTLGVLASGSRAGMIAFVAGSGYWFMHTNRKGFALGGVMVAGACFLYVAPSDFWERMGTILAEKDRNPWVQAQVEESKHERQVLWALAIDIYKENPWMGIGPGQYNYVSAERTEFTDPYEGRRGLQTHNTWLQLLSEYGTLGTGVWVLAFFLGGACYMFGRRRLRKKPGLEWLAAVCLGLEAGTLGNAIACVFNSFQWYDYHYWHFVFAPVVYQVAKETAEREDWLAPIDTSEPHPPPRYGPPAQGGLDLGAIDLSSAAPIRGSPRSA